MISIFRIIGRSSASFVQNYCTCGFTSGSYLHRESTAIVSWNSTIYALVKSDLHSQALHIFKSMLANDNRPNYMTILSVSRAADGCTSTTQIHGLVLKFGFHEEPAVGTVLVGLYSVFDFSSACKVFDCSSVRDLVFFTAIITACAKNRENTESFRYFRKMRSCGVHPNHVGVLSVLPCCADLKALSLGKQLHGFSVVNNFSRFTNLQNSLLHMYSKCDRFETSFLVFREIPIKDMVSWKTMICAYASNDYPTKSLLLFSEMCSNGVGIDEGLLITVISVCVQGNERILGHQIHCNAEKRGFMASVSTCTSILQMYGKFSESVCASRMFYQMKTKDLIAWTALISALVQGDSPSDTLFVFRQMLLAEVKPNAVTFVSLFGACSSIKAQKTGECFHSHVIKVGYYNSNPFISSSLIEFYSQMGRVNEGRTVFDETQMKDLVCWTSMINSYGSNGHGDEALEFFSYMIDCGIQPNEVVLLSVLSVCAHFEFEEEGWRWFYFMEDDKHGITPKLEHYTCMVDLLSRKGKIEEAFEFVKKMPMEPDKRIWAAVLSGCRRVVGFVEIAEIVVQRLLILDHSNRHYYDILTDLYAEYGRENANKMVRAFF